MIFEIVLTVMIMMGAIVMNTVGLAMASARNRNNQIKIRVVEQRVAVSHSLIVSLLLV